MNKFCNQDVGFGFKENVRESILEKWHTATGVILTFNSYFLTMVKPRRNECANEKRVVSVIK